MSEFGNSFDSATDRRSVFDWLGRFLLALIAVAAASFASVAISTIVGWAPHRLNFAAGWLCCLITYRLGLFGRRP